jgi:hypothetical protein
LQQHLLQLKMKFFAVVMMVLGLLVIAAPSAQGI